jgi:hypothetical protein
MMQISSVCKVNGKLLCCSWSSFAIWSTLSFLHYLTYQHMQVSRRCRVYAMTLLPLILYCLFVFSTFFSTVKNSEEVNQYHLHISLHTELPT